MRKFKTVKIKQEQMTNLICDFCGTDYGTDIYETQEFVSINTQGGYGSVFGDGEEIKVDICQYCFFKILKSRFDKKWQKKNIKAEGEIKHEKETNFNTISKRALCLRRS